MIKIQGLESLFWKENIRIRSGIQKLELFINKWIPMENRYFDEFNIKEKSMIVEWKDRQTFA